MTAISVNLHLQRALELANVDPKDLSTERLLLLLLDDHVARGVLARLDVDLRELRQRLWAAIDTEVFIPDEQGAGLRALERAALAASAADCAELHGGHVLVAILDDPDSHAASLLRAAGIGRLEATSTLAELGLGTPLHRRLLARLVGFVGRRHKPTPGPAGTNLVLHNDDFTTMEFVVELLQSELDFSQKQATRIMLEIHRNGQAIIGTFDALEVAERRDQLESRAREVGYPLRITVE